MGENKEFQGKVASRKPLGVLDFQEREALNHLKFLKSLIEIPFPIGKKLLIDFVTGDGGNDSIIKNKLDVLQNFDTLNCSVEEATRIIDNLISNNLISFSAPKYNKFIKVLEITLKGMKEVETPTLHLKKVSASFENKKTQITPEDLEQFKELEVLLSEFNNEQNKAIISNKEKILCVAGAGSGKTTALTKRIEFLVKYVGVKPNKILAITFTRKARNEMQKRLINLNVNARVETFNSFCEKILKIYGNRIYKIPTRIGSFGDKLMALSSALERLGMSREQVIDKYFKESQRRDKTTEQLTNILMNDCFSIINHYKIRNQEFEDFSGAVDMEDREIAKILFNLSRNLQGYMELQGLRDYTDQIVDAVNFLKQNPGVFQDFEHILVDEYQDVNSLQVELLDLLKPKNLFCVGDPRQSIYGWRGSNIDYILNFNKKHPDYEEITLTKNYRSDKKIVEFMNPVVETMNFPGLESNIDGSQDISLDNFEKEVEEYNFIINKIKASNVPREEIFVLARTNRQLLEISRLMKNHQIKHIIKAEDIVKPAEESKIGHLTLATIHSIKGLEANTVFVMGCNELNFPCKASDHPVIEMIKLEDYDKEEEERRLFYVAISRAKQNLHLTYTGKKPTYFINQKMLDMLE